MWLFRDQAKFLSEDETRRLLRLCLFIVKIYVHYWFSATDAVSAPRTDLTFIKQLLAYEESDLEVAKAALDKFTRHLWYLNEEMIGLSIFDAALPDEVRRNIVDACVSREPLEVFHKNRHLQLRDIPDMGIADLASTRTQHFFQILEIKTDFFEV